MYAVGVAARERNKTSEGNARSKRREEKKEEKKKKIEEEDEETDDYGAEDGRGGGGKRKQEKGDKIGIKEREKRRSQRNFRNVISVSVRSSAFWRQPVPERAR